MCPLGLAVQALGVKEPVHRARRCAFPIAREELRKSFGIPAAAVETRPMTGSKCRDFVKKEQLRVVAAPHVALTALEFQHAADPLPRHPTARGQRFVVAVELATAIPKQGAACSCRKQFTEWIDAILQRHAVPQKARTSAAAPIPQTTARRSLRRHAITASEVRTAAVAAVPPRTASGKMTATTTEPGSAVRMLRTRRVIGTYPITQKPPARIA